MISGKKSDIPFRLKKFMANEEHVDDFQVFPLKNEYTPILADMISLSFNVKICLYTYTQNKFAGARFECTNYTNKQDKEVSVFKLTNSFFLSLEEISAEESEDNFNYASTELLLESSCKNSSVSKEDDLEKSGLFSKTESVLDSVRNIIDESSENEINEPEVNIVRNLFKDSDASLSEISLEEDVLSKSQLSIDVEEPQVLSKKNSEVSNQETEDILSESNASNEKLENAKIYNLFSYDTTDKDLCHAFQSDYSINNLKYTQKLMTCDIFNMSTPLKQESDSQFCFENYQTPCLVDDNLMASNAAHDLKVKREILDLSERRYTGVLKFYNENKGFGFVGCEQDNTEIFLHGDDLLKANIDIKNLKKRTANGIIRFSFSILEYMGKYNRSRKVVDLKLVSYV